jgi:hypothetical protein
MNGTPIRIAIMGYEGVQTSNIAGPWDAFGAANSARFAQASGLSPTDYRSRFSTN